MGLEDYHFLFGARPIFGGCWLLVAGRDYLTWEFKAYPLLNTGHICWEAPWNPRFALPKN